MILLSNSLPKTGSSLIVDYQNKLLRMLGETTAQDILWSHYKGGYLGYPSKHILWKLFLLDLKKGSLVVKCHWSYSKLLNYYYLLPNVRMTYCYRDPRDIILSMIDHGERTRAGGDPFGAFKDCYNVLDLIPRTQKLLEQLRAWKSKDNIFFIRYENLMLFPEKVILEMLEYLKWEIEDKKVQQLIYDKQKNRERSYNFNKGTIERWREEMTDTEKAACLEAFKPYLEWLEYDLY